MGTTARRSGFAARNHFDNYLRSVDIFDDDATMTNGNRSTLNLTAGDLRGVMEYIDHLEQELRVRGETSY